MHEERAEPFGLFGQDSRRNRIDGSRSRFVRLSPVYSRIRSCVNDQVRQYAADHALNFIRFTEIELLPIECRQFAHSVEERS